MLLPAGGPHIGKVLTGAVPVPEAGAVLSLEAVAHHTGKLVSDSGYDANLFSYLC